MAKKSQAKPKSIPKAKTKLEGQRWDYETISLPRATEITGFNHRLNELGKDGWELVSAIPEDHVTFLIFKRSRRAA
jgi:hypothetical protein